MFYFKLLKTMDYFKSISALISTTNEQIENYEQIMNLVDNTGRRGLIDIIHIKLFRVLSNS